MKYSFILIIFHLTNSILGLFVHTYLVKIFGFSTKLDDYSTASTLTLSLYNLISVGLIVSLPTYIINKKLGYLVASRKIYLLSTIILFLLIAFFPVFYFLIYKNFNNINLNFIFLYIIFCVVGFLQLNVSLNNSFLVVSKRNILAAILFNLPNLLVFIFINLVSDFNLVNLSITILFSTLLQFIVQFMFLRGFDIGIIPSNNVLFGFKEIFLLSSPSLILCLSYYFEIIWSSNYGEGTISLLQFSNRMIAATLTILVISQLNNNLHYFIRYCTISKNNRLRFVLFTILAGLVSYLFIIIIINFFFEIFNMGEDSISSLFKYNNYISTGIVFYVASVCLIKLLFDNISFYKIVIILGIVWSIIYNFLNFIFSKESLFYLALSYNISWFIIFIILSFIFYEKKFHN